VLFFSNLKYKFKQIAVFGEATYSATDKLDLTGGYQHRRVLAALTYHDFRIPEQQSA